ncbi:hypothetical protein JD969_08900 [Planctomycetota bacterium]|nr:hypothetical protein JD969_08900 [Planctomycetota bacterium]
MNCYKFSPYLLGVSTLFFTHQILAAPVAYQVTATVNSASNTSNLPGDPTIGDTITATIVLDFDLATGPSNSGVIQSYTLESNGESLDFVSLFDDNPTQNTVILSNNIFDSDTITINLFGIQDGVNRGSQNGISLLLQYPEDTFNAGDPINFDAGDTNFTRLSFGLIDDEGSSRVLASFDSIIQIDLPENPDSPIAVPTPTAFMSLGLLVPLFLRRQHQ